MKTHGTALLALVVASVALGCAPRQAAEQRADTPRWIDGLVEPTLGAVAPQYRTDEERLELINKAMAHRFELLGKLPPPIALCKRVPDGSVTVDGELAEEEWRSAAVITGFRDNKELTPAKLQTRCMLQWDSKYLYIAFDCDDVHVIGTINEPDGEFWREDTAEVFIDVNGDEMSYIELEVNPQGFLYDATVSDYRPEIDWPPDYGHVDIDYGVKIYHTRDTHVGTRINGTLNDPDDVDKGWSCEIAMSWVDMARCTNIRRLPPRDGDVWRFGLYRINSDPGKGDVPIEYAAWNPTTTWFHAPWMFGRVVFVEQ